MTYRYSYEELCLPKDIPVMFGMYQLNFNEGDTFVYDEHRNRSENRFIERDV